MPQRVKPVTRLVGGSLSTSMTGVGVVGVTAQEVTGAGALAVSVGVASSGSGSAVIPGEAYTLADATTGLPFAVTHPTAPTISNTVNVTPATFGANNVNGNRLILDQGNYGNLTISGTDKEIVLTTGVIVDALSVSGQRIVVSANPARTGTINTFTISATAADVLFDGIYTNSTAVGTERNSINGGARLAIINSRLRTNDFVLVAFPDSAGVVDFIVGNNYLETYGTAQTAVRLHSCLRLAFVDNNLRATGGNGIFRFHNSAGSIASDLLYTGRNQYEGPFWKMEASGNASPIETEIGSVWVEDNTVYWNGLFYIDMNTLANDWFPRVFTQRNNTAYIASGNWKANDFGAAWTYTSTGNVELPYVDPPVWEHQ